MSFTTATDKERRVQVYRVDTMSSLEVTPMVGIPETIKAAEAAVLVLLSANNAKPTALPGIINFIF